MVFYHECLTPNTWACHMVITPTTQRGQVWQETHMANCATGLRATTEGALDRIQSDPRLQAIRQSKQWPLAASLILVCLPSGRNIHFHIQMHTVYIWILGYSSPNLAQLPCHPAPLPPHLSIPASLILVRE